MIRKEAYVSNQKPEAMLEKYQMIFDSSPFGICITEIDGSVKMNNTFCEMLGYTQEELLYAGWKDITFKEDIAKHHELFDIYSTSASGNKKIEKRFVKKDSTVIWTEVVSRLKVNDKGQPQFLLSMIRDISELKNVKEESKQNEIKFQQMFDKNPNPMYVFEPDSLKFLMVNEAAIYKYGYSEDEFLKMTLKDIRPPEDLEILNNNLNSNDSPLNSSENIRHRKKDGSIMLVKLSAQSINYNGGIARVITVIDVTQKVADKKNLVAEIAKHKSLIESTSDAIFSLDRNYCYTSFNSAHAMVMKNLYDADIEIGKSIFLYQTVDEDMQKSKENIDLALNGEQIVDISISGQSSLMQRYFEVVHNPIYDENGNVTGVSVFVRDITELREAALQLSKREKEYKLLFTEDLTGDVIATIDGKIILCNSKFLQIFGFNSEEEAHNTSADLLYKNPSDRNKLIQRIKEERKLENVELEMVRRDGKEIIVLENIVGQFNKEGEIEKLISYVIDITEQKIAFDKVKQLSKAVEQSPVTIVITDTDGNIQYINPRGIELTGYKIEELLNKNPRILSSGEKSKEEYTELWNTIKSGNEWRGEFHNKKKSGELYWEMASISPIVNEKGIITNYLAVKEDITERKKYLEELVAAKDKAEEISRIKSVFFSNMSHELRTPLVGILGFADILAESLEDESEKSMATSILQGGKRLLNTLTSLLSLSELETLKENIELKPINVNPICNDILKSFAANSHKPNIEYKVKFESEKLDLNINIRLFREALSQIVKNAFTYTTSGSVLIKTYRKNELDIKNCTGIIEIIDTGIGIPKDKLDIIFEEFRQASEGIGRNFEGTGVGLTLTKKYLELMNASISVESELGKGTKFILSFPLQVVSAIKPDLPQDPLKPSVKKADRTRLTINKELKKQRVLVVEDDEINNIFIKKCLNNLFEIESAKTGEQAIKLASENKFDIILMDINLGKDMDGITATQIIRKIRGYENIPIVAMTAYAAEEDKAEFLSRGCSHFLPKPFLMRELVEFVKNALSEKVIQFDADKILLN